MVYGGVPDFPEHDAAHWDLQPAMTLRSKVIGVQTLQPGDTIGYGSAYTCERATRVGIVACGYADGYPRHAPTGTPVLVDGTRSRTLGRVSMDMLAVDLSELPASGFGSEVTLWGEGPKASRLPIDEVAQAAGTIGYELMCAVAPRVPIRNA
jgi:alanine racemase